MPKSVPATVEEYLRQLDEPLRATVEFLRQLILRTDPSIGERIKWNSPSFYYQSELPPAADPRTYPRDVVVFNLHRGYPLLVFPTGARIPDTANLLEGQYPDGRRLLTIRSLPDAHAKAAGLQQVLRQWLTTV